jgi:hypothetical protein
MTNMTKFLLVTFAIFSLLLMSVLSLSASYPDDLSWLTRRAAPKNATLISRGSVLTYYFLVFEEDQKPGPTVTIRSCKKKPLATVLRSFAEKMKTEGSGYSKDGKIYNFDGKLYKKCIYYFTYNRYLKLSCFINFPFRLQLWKRI